MERFGPRLQLWTCIWLVHFLGWPQCGGGGVGSGFQLGLIQKSLKVPVLTPVLTSSVCLGKGDIFKLKIFMETKGSLFLPNIIYRFGLNQVTKYEISIKTWFFVLKTNQIHFLKLKYPIRNISNHGHIWIIIGGKIKMSKMLAFLCTLSRNIILFQ